LRKSIEKRHSSPNFLIRRAGIFYCNKDSLRIYILDGPADLIINVYLVASSIIGPDKGFRREDLLFKMEERIKVLNRKKRGRK